MTTFFAWAIPANLVGSWADHTWVTTFDNRTAHYATLADVVAHRQHLWMCWGSYHPKGGTPARPDGLLAYDNGNLALASCLVLDNQDSVHVTAARGTIDPYAIVGVCHQLANQVLYATGSRVSVRGCRGYAKSVYIYGQYGLRKKAWAAKVRSCSGGSGTGGSAMHDDPDDFETKARTVLRDRSDLLAELMAMREQYQAGLEELAVQTQLTASNIDERHRRHMDQVANLLGAARFTAIFDYNPAEEMNLVDPAILAASRARPAT